MACFPISAPHRAATAGRFAEHRVRITLLLFLEQHPLLGINGNELRPVAGAKFIQLHLHDVTMQSEPAQEILQAHPQHEFLRKLRAVCL